MKKPMLVDERVQVAIRELHILPQATAPEQGKREQAKICANKELEGSIAVQRLLESEKRDKRVAYLSWS